MTKPGWMIDELIYAGDEHLDPEYVEGYDEKSAVDHSDDIGRCKLTGSTRRASSSTWAPEPGCSRWRLLRYCKRVVAVDVSDAMLAILEREIERAGCDNIEVVHAGLLSYDHQGEPADFVYSRNTFHHLPDFWKALALQRIAEMLAPGGVLLLHDLVYSFDTSEVGEAIEGWLSRAAPTPDVGFTRADLELHVRTEYSTFSWLFEPMLGTGRAGDSGNAPPAVADLFGLCLPEAISKNEPWGWDQMPSPTPVQCSLAASEYALDALGNALARGRAEPNRAKALVEGRAAPVLFEQWARVGWK